MNNWIGVTNHESDFTQDVKGKGKQGEVKDVPVGYANNFLIKMVMLLKQHQGT